MKIQPASLKDRIKRDPLGQFFCPWDQEPSQGQVEELKRVIDSAKVEEDVQAYLAKNPHYMIQHFSGGHGRYVIPKQKFGSEYVSDFMVAERNSMGLHWTAIELENPNSKLFTKAGSPTAELTHAIGQILEWRTWIANNIDYARRRLKNDGLGLEQVDGNVHGIILMGRNTELTEKTNAVRRHYKQSMNIDIHTFDWLVDVAEKPGLFHPGEGLYHTVITTESGSYDA